MISIRRYLLKYLIAALLACSIAIMIFAYFNAKSEVDELFDSNLEQISETLAKQRLALELLEKEHPVTEGFSSSGHKRNHLKGEEEFLIQIWDNNNLIYTSHPAIKFPKLSKAGLNDSQFQDKRWRTSLVNVEKSVIQVSQPLDARDDILKEIALKFIAPLLLQLPILGLLIWLAVGKSLRPLVAISDDIQKRSSQSLQPLSRHNVPREVTPLLTALNDLLERLGVSMQMQHQFTADAAHELRTPLTAIQLQLEILQRAKNDSEKQEAMQKLSAGIQRSIHLVQQLLLLARMEPEAIVSTSANLDITALTKSCVEQLAPQAVEKHVNLGFNSLETLTVKGDVEALRVMISNLIDNAIRYTPKDGNVKVSVRDDNNKIMLEVADNGIGIAPEEHCRVFDRFYRVPGNGTFGTGIGLAIVKTIADQHDAEITIADGLDRRGTSFQVTFPKI